MKRAHFIVLLAAIAVAGVAWIYTRRLVNNEQATLAAQQARAVRLQRQIDTLEREHSHATRDFAARAPAHELKALAPAWAQAVDEESQAEVWRAKVTRLRGMFAARTDQSIPELQLLSDLDWLDLARKTRLDGDERIARARVRDVAVQRFFSRLTEAVQAYNKTAGEKTLTDVMQLLPFFAAPLDPAILARYGIEPNNSMGARPGTRVIAARGAVDEDYDGRQYIITDLKGSGGGGWLGRSLRVAMDDAVNAYRAANGGRISVKADDLLPLAQTPFAHAYLETMAAYERDHGGKRSEDAQALLPYATAPEVRSLFERIARVEEARRADQVPGN